MVKRVPISYEYPKAYELATHYSLVVDAIHLHHSESNPEFADRFEHWTKAEVRFERDKMLYEADAASAMMMLASIEATFRVDYLLRCYERRKDLLSRELRDLHQTKGQWASFSDDLLEVWRSHGTMPSRLIGDIRGAFGYRHWLAHGRYYDVKLGRQYDFDFVYDLAQEVESNLTSSHSMNWPLLD